MNGTVDDILNECIERLAAGETVEQCLASYPDHCIPTWLMWDMAPAVPQGDAFGLAIYGAGFTICVDLLGIQRQTGWRGAWRYGHAHDDDAYKRLGAEVRAALA